MRSEMRWQTRNRWGVDQKGALDFFFSHLLIGVLYQHESMYFTPSNWKLHILASDAFKEELFQIFKGLQLRH